MPVQEPDPIVVFGAPRSGTTYLGEILNSHPEVFISHEIRIFSWLHESLSVLPMKDEFIASYRNEFTQYLRQQYPDLIRAFYQRLKPDARYWGDKNPHYADKRSLGCLATIADLFPKSKFIHIMRDGRDVVASLVRKKDNQGNPWVDFGQAHDTWVSHVTIGTSFGATLPPNRYFELRYEDLIRDDIRVARSTFDFLGIAFHPDVEGLCRSQQTSRTPYSGPTRDLSRGAAASDWSIVFTQGEQARSLELLGEHLVKHRYETDESLTNVRTSMGDRVRASQGSHSAAKDGRP